MAKNIIEKTTKTLLIVHGLNSLIDIHAKGLAAKQNISGNYYDWEHGRIFYKKKGSGEPILLIHNLGHRSASYEWDDIIHFLAKDHTVYALDLPGCGRSEKNNYIYTTYLYVKLIKDFINNVIKERTVIISSGDSVGLCVISNAMHKTQINKLILINPGEIPKKTGATNSFKSAYMKLLYLPIIGTAVYNAENFSYNALRKVSLENKLTRDYIDHTVNAYIASHLDGSKSRYLRACKINNYLKTDFTKHLSKRDNISLISTRDTDDVAKYLNINPSIKISTKRLSGDFPHMIHPGKTYSTLKEFI